MDSIEIKHLTIDGITDDCVFCGDTVCTPDGKFFDDISEMPKSPVLCINEALIFIVCCDCIEGGKGEMKERIEERINNLETYLKNLKFIQKNIDSIEERPHLKRLK